MRRVTAKLEVTHPILAARTPGARKHVFPRAKGGALIFNPIQLHAATVAGLTLAGLLNKVYAGDIVFDTLVPAETTMINVKRGKATYVHEAIAAGEKITLTLVVPPAITDDVIRDILTQVGSFVGISPADHQRGYGRFAVLEITSEEIVNE